jgi:hypothetical protein
MNWFSIFRLHGNGMTQCAKYAAYMALSLLNNNSFVLFFDPHSLLPQQWFFCHEQPVNDMQELGMCIPFKPTRPFFVTLVT